MVKIIYLIYIAVLLYFGLISRRANWFSWTMFAQASFCEAKLFLNDEELNIWRYLPHSQIMINRHTLQSLLAFISKKHNCTNIHGTVKFHTASMSREYKVQNAAIV